MKNKKIIVLHAQIPFMHGGAELMVKTLVKKFNEFEFNAELVQIPFRWYPENSLYDNMLMWSMVDFNEVNGDKVDLVIPTKFPTYGVKHPNKVMWLIHQHRAAYDLYNNAEHFGLGLQTNGDKIRQVIQNYDNTNINESAKIFTISNNISNRLLKFNNIKSETLYHPPALENNYYCDKYENYVLSVGRLDPLKRVDLLLKAISKCNKNIKAKIVGVGPELNNLQKLAYDLKIEDRIEFLGYISDKQLLELYSNCFTVFFAPIDEDYGYITLEAFLSKKPIITCKDAGGVLEFAKNGENAFVCDNSVLTISDSIQQLYENKIRCKDMGNEGYSSVKDISWRNVIDSLTYNI